jgi:restriction system protein
MSWDVSMVRVIAWLLIVMSVLPFGARGQAAPEIRRGAGADEVVRLYGWPRARSAADTREIWVYDTFQVTFESGSVVGVATLPGKKSTPVRASPAANKRTATEKRPAAAPSASGAPATPAKIIPLSNAAAPSTSGAARPAAALTRQSAERTVASSPTEMLLKAWWPVLVMALLSAVASMFVAARRRRESAKKRGPERRAAQAPGKSSWKDVIGAQLAKANGTEASEPPLLVADELSVELLRKLEWKRFERIVALYYQHTGVRAECTCNGPDGGIDAKLLRRGEQQAFCYVQCKAWGSEKVPVTKVREFLGVMAADKIAQGVFITTSDFWPDARAFAEANNIAALAADDFVRRFNALPLESCREILAEVTAGDYTTPTCPRCDEKMVWRQADRPFWGCRNYPRCAAKPIYPRNG